MRFRPLGSNVPALWVYLFWRGLCGFLRRRVALRGKAKSHPKEFSISRQNHLVLKPCPPLSEICLIRFTDFVQNSRRRVGKPKGQRVTFVFRIVILRSLAPASVSMAAVSPIYLTTAALSFELFALAVAWALSPWDPTRSTADY